MWHISHNFILRFLKLVPDHYFDSDTLQDDKYDKYKMFLSSIDLGKGFWRIIGIQTLETQIFEV